MELVRVTEVLSPWCDFSKIPESTLQYAADRGTRCHEYCSRHAQGEFLVNIDQDCRPYVDSFRRWFDRNVETVILSEERLIDTELGFTGQIDLLIGSKSDNLIWLVDLKTPRASTKTWAMQLSAYRHLMEIGGEFLTPERVGSLRLSPDGKPAKMTWYEDSARDFNAFLSALNVYNYINE